MKEGFTKPFCSAFQLPCFWPGHQGCCDGISCWHWDCTSGHPRDLPGIVGQVEKPFYEGREHRGTLQPCYKPLVQWDTQEGRWCEIEPAILSSANQSATHWGRWGEVWPLVFICACIPLLPLLDSELSLYHCSHKFLESATWGGRGRSLNAVTKTFSSAWKYKLSQECLLTCPVLPLSSAIAGIVSTRSSEPLSFPNSAPYRHPKGSEAPVQKAP